MLDRNFIAARYTRSGGWLHSLREANSETHDVVGYALEDNILNGTPLKDVETPMLFTYMHRRFGLPSLGGDDYKDLSAAWILTTPVEDLALIVSPSFSGPGFSFRPVIVMQQEGRAGLQDITGERLAAMTRAYERTLLDLLRPIIQRDMDFNALGEITDENPVPDWAESDDEDDYDRLPRYHETCGLPMPDGVFGSRHWERVLTLFHSAGNGNYAAGMAAFVQDAEKRAREHVAGAREGILPIIAAGFHLARIDDAQDKVADLGLEADDPRIAEFCRASYGHGSEGKPSEWLMRVSRADILDAAEYVSAFGVGTHHLKKAVDKVERLQRQHVEWARFMEISGGEFDEDLIPDVQFITGDAVEEWRRNLAQSGDLALSEWAEHASADPNGYQAVAHVLSRLHFVKADAARKAAAPDA